MISPLILICNVALAIAPYELEVITSSLERVKSHRQLRMSKKAPLIPASAYSKAAKGEIATGLEKVDGIEAGKGWGIAVFDASIENLFAALNDEEKHKHNSPIKHTEVLRVGSCKDKRKVLMIMPTPIIKDRWWVTELRINNKLKHSSNGMMRELAWNVIEDASELVKGSKGEEKIKKGLQITFSSGSWLLIKLDDGHTLAEYFTWADPGGAIPAGPASVFTAGQISNYFKSIDHYVQNTDNLPCIGKMR